MGSWPTRKWDVSLKGVTRVTSTYGLGYTVVLNVCASNEVTQPKDGTGASVSLPGALAEVWGQHELLFDGITRFREEGMGEGHTARGQGLWAQPAHTKNPKFHYPGMSILCVQAAVPTPRPQVLGNWCGVECCVTLSKCLSVSGPHSGVSVSRKSWVTLGKLS